MSIHSGRIHYEDQLARDPAVDPQYGDIVRSTIYKNCRERHPIKRYGAMNNEVQYYSVTAQKSVIKSCWITTWQDWCRKNKVEIIQRAEDLRPAT